MNNQKKRLIRGLLLIFAAFSLTGALIAYLQIGTSPQASTSVQALSPQVRNFTLYVRANFLKMPDGKRIYVFGYTADPHGQAQVPGPTLIVNQGDTVNLTLINDHDPTNTHYNPGGDGHTIHLHGLDLPSIYDGDPMTAPYRTSDGQIMMTPPDHTNELEVVNGSVKQGQRFTYHFIANTPGTYWYHCHEDAPEHIQMGMYGAFIIRPAGLLNAAYANTPTFNKEYTFVLSEMDSVGHQIDYNNIYHGGPSMNWTHYQPDYFLINGKAWPDTMMDPNDSINATIGQTVLVRLINTGSEVHAMHTHGFHFLVIGTDGRKLDAPYYKDTLLVASGERYDIILRLNQVGRYMMHDHIEQNTTNAGAYLGGMTTMITVNYPDGSNPVPMPSMNGQDNS